MPKPNNFPPLSKQAKPKKSDASSSSMLGWLAMPVVATVLGIAALALRTSRLNAAADDVHVTACRSTASKPRFKGCTPHGTMGCGRLTRDDFATAAEVKALREIAARGMAMGGGGAGGPTILDLQSGAVSYGENFIDVWAAFNSSVERPFRKSELRVYADVAERIRKLAESTFSASGLRLTAPTFFSRISGDKAPVTAHDEYWHVHVDERQYGSFAYTALLYLADAGSDFEGGAFEFMASSADPPRQPAAAAVQPRKGRLVLFTSGDEHPHRVTRVTLRHPARPSRRSDCT